MNVDNRASREWSSRPQDQRFLSLESLYDFTRGRADKTNTYNQFNKTIKVLGTEPQFQGDLGELVAITDRGPNVFENWSFGQLAQHAGAPAGYLRKLPSALAAACLNDGLAQSGKESMLQSYDDVLRCATSTTYGRIWDYDVVGKIQEVTNGGSWKIPSSSYGADNPKRATTLYASDRDVFIFMVDEDHPIQLPGQNKPSYRGFYAWNSEVGSQTFGLAAFLYETVCDNRNIWGVSNRQELRIKHSSGAPERFLQEGKKALIEYANESTSDLMDKIKRAQNRSLGADDEEVQSFLKKRGFSIATAAAAVQQAKMEEGDLTAWSVTRGLTAVARGIGNQDSRIVVERMAGKIMEDI